MARGAKAAVLSGAVLDHLVIGARDLAQGVAYLKALTGVDIPLGGTHPLMGTHNHLTRIGAGVFLEIIAVDPAAPTPASPRWFGLDDAATQARLRQRPRLLSWVAGVPQASLAAGSAAAFGTWRAMSRGDLTWRIAFPESGAVAEGVLPALIAWDATPHPAGRMADRGLRFAGLRLFHPDPARIRRDLAHIGAEGLATVATADVPRLEADLLTPDGRVVTLD